MSRVAVVIASGLFLVATGCVSKQVHDREVSRLRNELNAAGSTRDQLSTALRGAEGEKARLEAQLKELEPLAAESTRKLAALEKKLESLKGSLVEQLREVPGVTFEKTGAVLVTVPFPLGGTELPQDAANALKEVAAALAKTGGPIFVDGHSDNVPVAHPETRRIYGDNLGLSLARAAAVARVLIDNQVQSDRLITRGFGSMQPVASNDEAEGRAKNRRVEIYYTPAKQPEAQPAPEEKPSKE